MVLLPHEEDEAGNERRAPEQDAQARIEEQADDGEPFEEKMARLTTELYGLFKESHALEEEICRKLAAIGYPENELG